MGEPVLRKGSNDPAVRNLQEALRALGHYSGPIDGMFGEATESAVKAFQQEREITVDGIVGKITWLNIDEADQSEPVLRLGSTGLPVRRARSG
jgi:peptidoglycan hydrolase-like protein with peptidoglycan-binding domain